MIRRRRPRLPWLFALLVVLPTFMAIAYYYKHASDQYVSEAHFIIQGNNAPQSDLLGALTGIPAASGSGRDAMIIRDYLLSLDFLQDIEAVFDVRAHFSQVQLDGVARLPRDASREDLLKYWQSMIELDYDLTSGVSTVKMTAFDPGTSKSLLEIALLKSEELVNRLFSRQRDDALAIAGKEARSAEVELDRLRGELTRFRIEENALDPTQEASAGISAERSTELSLRQGLVAQLQGQLATAEAELADVSAYMRPDALRVKAAQRQVNALRGELAKAQASLDSYRRQIRQQGPSNAAAATRVGEYAELQSRLAFAEQVYRSKQATLEQTRLEVERQQRYLVVTVQPNLPDASTKPNRPMGVLTVLVLSFLAWGIGSLSLAAIRDHVGWV
ncbi:MAG: hypothetical protein KDI15_08750 [Thiothrix sp.]|nr:hypothetical protein [Thiothrix sp.]